MKAFLNSEKSGMAEKYNEEDDNRNDVNNNLAYVFSSNVYDFAKLISASTIFTAVLKILGY